ncbi:pimelyl-ACP methyl ester esterase BioV [Helicobacter sp. NHP19-003]|uniref:Pimelyl-ACP methyl ester esterase BioV n=1 Tax=Helicobacter gastrocanis TaxID=2849641 RepID=A0ABM7SCP4_9HELI|nr:pimelyl-ACP methyl ester esterase BioV [Helicobacter sp. NHP19-003]BCZ17463.1 pimelyl-ACP methyl ester esterase BioV [Helicobacter sp. NHP19-003]
MRYFSGFGFCGESVLFSWILKDCGVYDMAGFSYGALKALECAYGEVLAGRRVQKLILISPCMLAFKPIAFKRLQILSYKKDPKAYMQAFLKNIGWDVLLQQDPSLKRCVHLGSLEALEDLLFSPLAPKKLAFLRSKGVVIEVFLGLKDPLLEPQTALEFFKPYACVWQFKHMGHLLA